MENGFVDKCVVFLIDLYEICGVVVGDVEINLII